MTGSINPDEYITQNILESQALAVKNVLNESEIGDKYYTIDDISDENLKNALKTESSLFSYIWGYGNWQLTSGVAVNAILGKYNLGDQIDIYPVSYNTFYNALEWGDSSGQVYDGTGVSYVFTPKLVPSNNASGYVYVQPKIYYYYYDNSYTHSGFFTIVEVYDAIHNIKTSSLSSYLSSLQTLKTDGSINISDIITAYNTLVTKLKGL